MANISRLVGKQASATCKLFGQKTGQIKDPNVHPSVYHKIGYLQIYRTDNLRVYSEQSLWAIYDAEVGTK